MKEVEIKEGNTYSLAIGLLKSELSERVEIITVPSAGIGSSTSLPGNIENDSVGGIAREEDVGHATGAGIVIGGEEDNAILAIRITEGNGVGSNSGQEGGHSGNDRLGEMHICKNEGVD